MPRLVVPIWAAPRAPSRAASISLCQGRISEALSASTRLCGETSTPCARMPSISVRRCQGSTTTPLPMTDSLPPRTRPEGSSASLNTLPSMTSVWPALWPPWKRTTTSARADSQSTILPLPSSPHWAPTTTTPAMTHSVHKRGDKGRNWLRNARGRFGPIRRGGRSPGRRHCRCPGCGHCRGSGRG